MDQQLSDARMRIVQLTAEVQSSKQAAQHHEGRTAALQAQVLLGGPWNSQCLSEKHLHMCVYILLSCVACLVVCLFTHTHQAGWRQAVKYQHTGKLRMLLSWVPAEAVCAKLLPSLAYCFVHTGTTKSCLHPSVMA